MRFNRFDFFACNIPKVDRRVLGKILANIQILKKFSPAYSNNAKPNGEDIKRRRIPLR